MVSHQYFEPQLTSFCIKCQKTVVFSHIYKEKKKQAKTFKDTISLWAQDDTSLTLSHQQSYRRGLLLIYSRHTNQNECVPACQTNTDNVCLIPSHSHNGLGKNCCEIVTELHVGGSQSAFQRRAWTMWHSATCQIKGAHYNSSISKWNTICELTQALMSTSTY